MADDERPPEITPWGERDEPDKFFGGFWWVNTERHGGLYLTAEQRKAIPESLKAHSTDRDGTWWEEDSAWSLPVMCLLSGRPEASLTEEEKEKLYFADQTCQDNYPREWEQLMGRKLEPDESLKRDDEKELTVHNLLEDPWLVLDHPLPETADPQLLKAARAAAVVCRYEAEDLIAHDSKDPHARDLKKIDAIFTDIRQRLGEPELEGLPLDPEMEKTLNELEKNWKAQPQKHHDRER